MRDDDSSHGEEAQLVLLLEKLEERRKFLKMQQQDIENSLDDLENIAANAEAALANVRKGQTPSKVS